MITVYNTSGTDKVFSSTRASLTITKAKNDLCINPQIFKTYQALWFVCKHWKEAHRYILGQLYHSQQALKYY